MALRDGIGFTEVRLTLGQKLWNVNWTLVLLICLTASIGFAMLYSVSEGTVDTWVKRQTVRFGVGFVLMLLVALVDIRFWLRYAYAIYFLALALLGAVEVIGVVGMGAQRWVDLGVVNLQPSEIMKIALVLALARYFHGLSAEEVERMRWLLIPVVMVAAPVVLVLRQPDLGTALLLAIGAGAMFFLAGVRLWIFGSVLFAGLAAIPFAWHYLRDYQRDRILTFLNPERDPLGAGYHILQSKIALGSGGLVGKGFMNGSQSQLDFLPEKQTDFIFTMLAEEFGLIGGLVLLALYGLMLAYGAVIALRSRNHFGRLLGMGVSFTFFVYFFINIAMVTGLIPVVGVPLPLISYGGTAMVTILIGFGLLICVCIHRDVRIPRRAGMDES
ncbi:MAG: rod shape-determining protein RodA [Alphaproteobacteria bacterium]|jgi:rod shape determining protein RodA|nr:rod shape-determining protein RodA [Rhodospirillaceae bacterium]MDP6404044.1 rod shape-determining protein RodA [Alphaproteobacteria bacterium]MDP6622636.1 rod shape-determining protein RodA [Alphaproteobacteria bacterium]|tara:strand:- start:332 stop:1489 length:1158 start_codon:yes stop_codon:yes gene_type:complete